MIGGMLSKRKLKACPSQLCLMVGQAQYAKRSCVHFTVKRFKDILFAKQSVADENSKSNVFKNLIEEMLTSLPNERIVAAVADNARNMQGGLKLINAAHPRLLAVKCSAHLLNLISGDVFNKIDIAADALKSLDTMVGQGLLARYSPVR